MASFQLLKSPFSFSLSNPDVFSTMVRRRFLRVRFQRKNPILNAFVNTNFRVCCRVQDSGNQSSNGEEPPESLFMKELRRRGMTPTSLLEETNTNIKEDKETIFREEDGGFYRRNALSTDSGRNLTNQREQSMALNSEGLEGLIPRAKLLLTLGGTFFLAFWPLILATIASFSAVYLYFGPQFVHDASNRLGPPPYVDPYVLLEEERISQIAPPLN